MRRRLFNTLLNGWLPDYHRMVYEVIGPVRFSSKLLTRTTRTIRRLSADTLPKSDWRSCVNSPSSRSALVGRWLYGSSANLAVEPFLSFRASVLDRAETAARKEFTVSGRLLRLNEPPHFGRWDVDPDSGERWPQESVFSRRHDFPGDIRFPWELGRLHHLVWFGQAWRYTKDARWPRLALDHIEELIGEAPFEHGVHWRDGLQLAIRTFSLIALADLCHDAGPQFHERVRRVVSCHERALRRQLSPHGEITNNHVIGEASGLVLLGLYLDRTTTVAAALARLRVELNRQLYADGVPFEGSLPYIRFDLDFLLLIHRAISECGQPAPPWLGDSIDRISDALSSLVDRGGLLPPIGDGDEARVLRLDDSPYLNVNESLHLAAAITSSPRAASKDDAGFAAWVAGPPRQPVRHLGNSVHLPASGLVHLRRGLIDVWIDCGPTGLGTFGPGGHGHNDTTAIVLHLRGRALLHDPGWYSYYADRRMRDLLRGTHAHNTITIDDQEQARLGGLFEILDDCQPTPVRLRDKGTLTYVRCGHTGFDRLSKGIHYRRQIIFGGQGRCHLRVTDLVSAAEAVNVRVKLGSDFQWRRLSAGEWTLPGGHVWRALMPVADVSVRETPTAPATGILTIGSALEWTVPVYRRTRDRWWYRSRWELVIHDEIV